MPPRYLLVNQRTGAIVATAVEHADSMLARIRGLLGRDHLEDGAGIWLRPSGSIHTAFMRFPIDVVMLDRHDRVLRTIPALPPWRVAATRRAKSVIELPAGTLDRYPIEPGDPLAAQHVPDDPRHAHDLAGSAS